MKALEEFNISFNPDLIHHCEFQSDMGYKATCNLLSNFPDIDGIYAINDRIALGVMAAIRSLGKRIPEDIAVIGFNDSPFDPLLNPSLSSIYQPSDRMGEAAGKIMLQHLRMKQFVPVKKVFDTALIIRDSSSKRTYEMLV